MPDKTPSSIPSAQTASSDWLTSGGATPEPQALKRCYPTALDLRARARRRLPRFAFEYLDGGAGAGLFNLSPFRGPSAGAGTVFELGKMAAQGKPVFGYSNDPAAYEARAVRSQGQKTEEDGVLRDRDGHMIERFGLADNLMIAEAIRQSGGDTSVAEEKAEPRLAAMAAFEAALAIPCTRAV